MLRYFLPCLIELRSLHNELNDKNDFVLTSQGCSMVGAATCWAAGDN
ncbi:MAG: hypothetical protein ACYTXA_01905 [Nostoc sp.]